MSTATKDADAWLDVAAHHVQNTSLILKEMEDKRAPADHIERAKVNALLAVALFEEKSIEYLRRVR